MGIFLMSIFAFFQQCAPPGCLIELCIQLSMIMLGKQLIQNNVFEVLIPYVYLFFSVTNIQLTPCLKNGSVLSLLGFHAPLQ